MLVAAVDIPRRESMCRCEIRSAVAKNTEARCPNASLRRRPRGVGGLHPSPRCDTLKERLYLCPGSCCAQALRDPQTHRTNDCHRRRDNLRRICVRRKSGGRQRKRLAAAFAEGSHRAIHRLASRQRSQPTIHPGNPLGFGETPRPYWGPFDGRTTHHFLSSWCTQEMPVGWDQKNPVSVLLQLAL